MATKKPTVKTATQEDAAFITTTAREFALSYPDELDDVVKRIQEWLTHPKSEKGLTPLEVIVRKFEEEARAILKKQGHATTIEKLLKLEEENTLYSETGGMLYVNLDITALNAKQVILSAKALREAIKRNQAEEAALAMLKLFSAAVCADLHDTIITGARLKAGQKKEKPPRAALAIKGAIKTLLKEHPKYNYKQLWNYIKTEHGGQEKARRIILHERKYDVFYSHYANEIIELQYHPVTNEIFCNKNITKDRFKKYFYEVKKLAS
jgi:hypothetical protein